MNNQTAKLTDTELDAVSGGGSLLADMAAAGVKSAAQRFDQPKLGRSSWLPKISN